MIAPAGSHLLQCARCGASNRVPIERAFTQAGQLRCGRCRQLLLLTPDVPWRGSGADYQHPLDREALSAVRELPGVDSLLKKLIENTFVRYDRLFHQASYVRASPRQLPTLHRLFERAAMQLGINELPELYLFTNPMPNAHTGGAEQPYVAISTGLVDLMDDDEVGAVFAHELSHWQCRHVLYKTASRLLIGAASAIAAATLGLGNLLIVPIKLALLKWDRCSELTADRGMMLATRSPELAMRVLFKLAGGSFRLRSELSLEQFIDQADRARAVSEEGVLDRIFSLLQALYLTHPFPLWRAAELWRWACDGEYLDLIRASA